MKIGIIGSGVVAQTLGAKLVELGHEVFLGTRDPQKLEMYLALWVRLYGSFQNGMINIKVQR
jgi:ketopantoate reductase